MDFEPLVRNRRMTRSFTDEPVDAAIVDRIVDLGRRAPSAGNSQGWDALVLTDREETSRYWDTTLAPERRPGFPWPRLLDAPVLIVPVASPDRYVRRYGEADKARTGLGQSADRWGVPYWFVDAGMGVMTMLLAAADAGLGALFFGIFDATDAVKATFEIPEPLRPIGTIAIGHPTADQRRSRSIDRGRRPLDQVIHRGRW